MISNIQVFILFFMAILSTLVIIYPPKIAGVNGWIAGLLASMYVVFMITVFSLATKRDKGRTLTDVINNTLVVKYIVNLVVVFFLITLGAITIADLRALILIYTLPDTPVVVVIVVILIISAAAAKQGLEAIARVSEFTFGASLILIIIIVIGGLPNVDLEKLLPVLELGIGPPILGSISVADFIGYIFLIMYILPYVNKPERTPSALFYLLGFIAVFLVVQSIYVIGTFGDIFSETMLFPIMELVRYIEIADILSNLEVPLLVTWIPTIIIKLSLVTWVSANILKRTLNLKGEEAIITPITLIIGVWAMAMFPSATALIKFGRIFGIWAVTVEYIIQLPVLVYVYFKSTRKP